MVITSDLTRFGDDPISLVTGLRISFHSAMAYLQRLARSGACCLLLIPGLLRGASDGTFNYTVVGETVTIDKLINTWTNGTVQVPAFIAGRPVTVIGAVAFLHCRQVTEVRLPGSLTRIEAGAFAHCSALKKIHLPGGLVEIGDWAFAYSRVLTRIDLPEGLQRIHERAFLHSGLESIRIPSSVVEIGEGAFERCGRLKHCRIEPGLREIPLKAFFACHNLSRVNFPAGLRAIGESAFEGSGLVRVVVPDSVRSLAPRTFADCLKLKRAVLRGRLAEIADSSFEGCRRLEEVVLPPSLRVIGDSAFRGCQSLFTLAVPAKVTKVGKFAFADCGSLASIRFAGNAPKANRNIFARVAAGFKVFLDDGAKGFTAPRWLGQSVVRARAAIRVTDRKGKHYASGEDVLKLGSAMAGKRGKVVKLRVWNVGNRPLESPRAATGGPNFKTSGFSKKPLAAGSFATVRVVFTPTAVGRHKEILQISGTNSGKKPFEVALAGSGLKLLD